MRAGRRRPSGACTYEAVCTRLVRGGRVRDISGLDVIHELLVQRDDTQRCPEPGDPDRLTTES
jgi:hypothetical protein